MEVILYRRGLKREGLVYSVLHKVQPELCYLFQQKQVNSVWVRCTKWCINNASLFLQMKLLFNHNLLWCSMCIVKMLCISRKPLSRDEQLSTHVHYAWSIYIFVDYFVWWWSISWWWLSMSYGYTAFYCATCASRKIHASLPSSKLYKN